MTKELLYALLERFVRCTAVPSGNLAMGPWVSGNSRFLDGFPRFSGTPPFPSISHVFHMFAIGLMGCL